MLGSAFRAWIEFAQLQQIKAAKLQAAVQQWSQATALAAVRQWKAAALQQADMRQKMTRFLQVRHSCLRSRPNHTMLCLPALLQMLLSIYALSLPS